MKENKPIYPIKKLPSRNELVEGEDYYINKDGFWVFTAKYHLKRGYCCTNGCLHCPYKKEQEE